MQASNLLLVALVLAATCGNVVQGESSLDALLDSAGKLESWLISTRRELHQYPELMFEVSQF